MYHLYLNKAGEGKTTYNIRMHLATSPGTNSLPKTQKKTLHSKYILSQELHRSELRKFHWSISISRGEVQRTQNNKYLLNAYYCAKVPI